MIIIDWLFDTNEQMNMMKCALHQPVCVHTIKYDKQSYTRNTRIAGPRGAFQGEWQEVGRKGNEAIGKKIYKCKKTYAI